MAIKFLNEVTESGVSESDVNTDKDVDVDADKEPGKDTDTDIDAQVQAAIDSMRKDVLELGLNLDFFATPKEDESKYDFQAGGSLYWHNRYEGIPGVLIGEEEYIRTYNEFKSYLDSNGYEYHEVMGKDSFGFYFNL